MEVYGIILKAHTLWLSKCENNGMDNISLPKVILSRSVTGLWFEDNMENISLSKLGH